MFTGRSIERDKAWPWPKDRNDRDYDTPKFVREKKEGTGVRLAWCAARLVGGEPLCGKTAN